MCPRKGGQMTNDNAPWTLKRQSEVCIRITFPGVAAGWKQRVLLRGDAHWDHPKANQALAFQHLDQALEQNAPVIDVGDFFCVMQAAHDPRATKGDERPEHTGRNYINRVVKDAVDKHEQYKMIWALLAQGNHETGFQKHHSLDITEMFSDEMQKRGGITEHGGYRGWVQFRFVISKTVTTTKRLYYTHGRGGQAPVTRGAIKTNRRAVILANADIVLSGHTHDTYVIPIPRWRLSDHGREYKDRQLHIQVPGYKDPVTGCKDGWEHEHEMGPKPEGAIWLEFACRMTRAAPEILMTATEAL